MEERWMRFDKIIDMKLLVPLLGIILAGVLTVLSATQPISLKDYGDKWAMFRKHIFIVITGLGLMLWAFFLNLEKLRRYSLIIYLLMVLLLSLTLVKGIGVMKNGSMRWIEIFGLSFQPSEIAKVGLIFVLAHFLSKMRHRMSDFFIGVLIPVVGAGLIAFLVYKEPDFGTACILMAITGFMIFIGRARLLHLIVLAIPCIVAFKLFVGAEGYRRDRIEEKKDRWDAPLDKDYQTIQSLIAINNGGVTLTGRGPGRSLQKFAYLPYAYSDYCFSIFAEEYGLVGVTTIFFFFIYITIRGFLISLRAENFESYLGLGIVFFIAMSFLLNVAIVSDMFYPKGMTMLFMSYGGTSMWVSLIAYGFLLNISSKTMRLKLDNIRIKKTEDRKEGDQDI